MLTLSYLVLIWSLNDVNIVCGYFDWETLLMHIHSIIRRKREKFIIFLYKTVPFSSIFLELYYYNCYYYTFRVLPNFVYYSYVTCEWMYGHEIGLKLREYDLSLHCVFYLKFLYSILIWPSYLSGALYNLIVRRSRIFSFTSLYAIQYPFERVMIAAIIWECKFWITFDRLRRK